MSRRGWVTSSTQEHQRIRKYEHEEERILEKTHREVSVRLENDYLICSEMALSLSLECGLWVTFVLLNGRIQMCWSLIGIDATRVKRWQYGCMISLLSGNQTWKKQFSTICAYTGWYYKTRAKLCRSWSRKRLTCIEQSFLIAGSSVAARTQSSALLNAH